MDLKFRLLSAKIQVMMSYCKYVIVMMSQTFLIPMCRIQYIKLYTSAKFHDHWSNKNKFMMGDIMPPMTDGSRKSPCQIG